MTNCNFFNPTLSFSIFCSRGSTCLDMLHGLSGFLQICLILLGVLMLRHSCANWVKLIPSKLENEFSDRIPARCIPFVSTPRSAQSHSSEHRSGPSRSCEERLCIHSTTFVISARRERLISSGVEKDIVSGKVLQKLGEAHLVSCREQGVH